MDDDYSASAIIRGWQIGHKSFPVGRWLGVFDMAQSSQPWMNLVMLCLIQGPTKFDDTSPQWFTYCSLDEVFRCAGYILELEFLAERPRD